VVGAVLRPSRPDDIGALMDIARAAGSGFTNIPEHEPALSAKLERSQKAMTRPDDTLENEQILMILEDRDTHEVIGCCQLFTQIGTTAPFYSYRLGVLTQKSQELDRLFRAEMLTLSTDLEGSSEVGGLFLYPHARKDGQGKLLARSRYLFIRAHRARFASRVIAELRGVVSDEGLSPFWDGLAGPFFDMSFREADSFNATRGNQFIADLFPKTPIYTAMLPESAREVMAQPHPQGVPAMRLLEREGFAGGRYVDIFDGGPTMVVDTDNIRTIREAEDLAVASGDPEEAQPMIVASGKLTEFRATLALGSRTGDGGVRLDADSREAMGYTEGENVTVVDL